MSVEKKEVGKKLRAVGTPQNDLLSTYGTLPNCEIDLLPTCST